MVPLVSLGVVLAVLLCVLVSSIFFTPVRYFLFGTDEAEVTVTENPQEEIGLEEKRQKAHELRDKERRFWEALKTELAPEHIPKNGG